MKDQPEFAYVGVESCGCITAAVVDNPEHAKDVRASVRDIMKWGIIERMSVAEVRKAICLVKHPKKTGCPHPGGCPSRIPVETHAQTN